MVVVAHGRQPGKQPLSERTVTEQRLLLHNVSWNEYVAIGEALKERPALRLTYDRGNLEIMTTSSPPAPAAWTSDTQRLLLYNIDWQEYDMLLHALDRHKLRLTYDCGRLEFMTLSPEHERYKHLLRRLLEVLGEECNVPIEGLGSPTCRRKDVERGLEPDECYYLKNWKQIRGNKRIDLTYDPPPELVVEIDITHSSLDRLKACATLGVAEIWRFDGKVLQIYRLRPDGQYEMSDRSSIFPAIQLAALVRFVHQGDTKNEMSVVRAFRAWVRKQLDKKGD